MEEQKSSNRTRSLSAPSASCPPRAWSSASPLWRCSITQLAIEDCARRCWPSTHREPGCTWPRSPQAEARWALLRSVCVAGLLLSVAWLGTAIFCKMPRILLRKQKQITDRSGFIGAASSATAAPCLSCNDVSRPVAPITSFFSRAHLHASVPSEEAYNRLTSLSVP